MGASGSGKTTLMNILGCLDRPTEGLFRFMGEDVSGFDRDELARLRRNAFGFVFQSYNLIATARAQRPRTGIVDHTGSGRALGSPPQSALRRAAAARVHRARARNRPPTHQHADGGDFTGGLLEAAKTAVRALRANLFRTVLTLLGIMIGVSSVITMLVPPGPRPPFGWRVAGCPVKASFFRMTCAITSQSWCWAKRWLTICSEKMKGPLGNTWC